MRVERNGGFATVRVPVDIPLAATSVNARRVVDMCRAAIQIGAPTYNTGNHAGCRDVYVGAVRQGAEALDWSVSPALAAQRVRLLAAVDQAAQEDPTTAAWTMRRALDRCLSDSTVSDRNALLLHVRGDGRAYELRVHRPVVGGSGGGGRGGSGEVAYEARFATQKGEAVAVCVPLQAMRAKWRGMDVADAPPLVSVSDIADVGFMAVKTDGVGDFALECMGVFAVCE